MKIKLAYGEGHLAVEFPEDRTTVIEPTAIAGVFVVDVDPLVDERGLFARTFSADQFAAAGVDPTVTQCSASFNRVAATLRGMHFQQAPYGETKLVRCTRGRVFDVCVDARLGSSTWGEWLAEELDPSTRRALVLPPGVAHGFLTLEADSEVLYQISVPFRAEATTGFRWDDPDVGIDWPLEPAVMSERDRGLPALRETPYVPTTRSA